MAVPHLCVGGTEFRGELWGPRDKLRMLLGPVLVRRRPQVGPGSADVLQLGRVQLRHLKIELLMGLVCLGTGNRNARQADRVLLQLVVIGQRWLALGLDALW